MELTNPWPDGWRLAPLAAAMLLPLCRWRGARRKRGRLHRPGGDRSCGGGLYRGRRRHPRRPAQRSRPAAAAGRLRSAIGGGVARHCAQLGGGSNAPAPENWRIFIAVDSGGGNAPSARPAPPAIKRGDALTIVVRGRGFSVQQSGEAMENGAVGEWIFRTDRAQGRTAARPDRTPRSCGHPGKLKISLHPLKAASRGPFCQLQSHQGYTPCLLSN